MQHYPDYTVKYSPQICNTAGWNNCVLHVSLTPHYVFWPIPWIDSIGYEFKIFCHLNRIRKISARIRGWLYLVRNMYFLGWLSDILQNASNWPLLPIFSLNSNSVNVSPNSSINWYLEIRLVPVQTIALHLRTMYIFLVNFWSWFSTYSITLFISVLKSNSFYFPVRISSMFYLVKISLNRGVLL